RIMENQGRSENRARYLRNFFSISLLVFISGFAGCGGGSGGSTPPGNATPEQLAAAMTASFSDAGIGAALDVLGRSGITVVNDDGSAIEAAAAVQSRESPKAATPGTTGLSVLHFQARGMAQEVFNQSGFLGADVDLMTPPIPLPGVGKSITVSMMLAAYVKTADSDGAKVARSLMGNIDLAKHAELVYPSIVVLTFLQEVAVPLLAEMEVENGPAAAASVASAFETAFAGPDPCGAINSFLDDLPTAVSGAINSISPESSSFWSGVVSVAAVIGGVATNLAVDAAKGIVRHLPAVTAVRNGMTALHAAADVKAMLTQWQIDVAGGPGNLHKSPGAPTAGTFTVTLSNSGPTLPDWPQAVKSCADLLAIPLPDFNNPSATVKWKTIAGFNALAIESSQEQTLTAGKAEFKFNTATESQSVHDNPGSQLLTGPATVEATVSLPGLESLMQTLANGVGGTVAQVANGAVATPAAQALGMVKPGTVPVEYHSPQVARITFDNGLERLNVESPDGVSPDGSWSGTFASNLVAGQCGGWIEVPVSWTFSGGTATLSVNLTFPGNGTMTEACNFNFTETLTLATTPSGSTVTTAGFYDSSVDPIDPGYVTPPVETAGSRSESYVVELLGAP
ncbi:MAG: hypothetical protein V1879_03185, partial [Pseudomonadota bacterium]